MSVVEERLWEQFGTVFDSFAISQEFAGQIAAALNAVQERSLAALKKEMQDFKDQVAAAEREEDQAYDDLRKRILDEVQYRCNIERIRSQKHFYTTRLQLANEAIIKETATETARSILELATNAKSLWLSRGDEDKKGLLKQVLSNQVLDGTTVKYDLKKPFAMLAEIKGKTVEWDWEDSNLRPRAYQARALTT